MAANPSAPATPLKFEIEDGATELIVRCSGKIIFDTCLPAPPRQFDWFVSYARGRALLLAGQGMAAAVEFQKIIDHRYITHNMAIAPACYVWLARARTKAGDTTGARRAYQDFFAIWKDADPELRILRQAKAEYAKLN